ncbi:MAG: heparinase II/III domain-containing protein [Candidatus Latescibacterota bacterium]
MKYLPVILALIFASAAAAFPDVTSRDIEAAIDRAALRHPYLSFSESEKPALHERIRTDPACRDIADRLLAEANRLLYTPVDPAPQKPKNVMWENTWPVESWIFTQADRAHTLAFVYQLTGERKYAEKAFEFADAVCDLPTWVHGYHEFPIFYNRVWPWGAKDDQVVFGYAQWSDHIVFRLAASYDWLYPALEDRQRDRIRGALLEKAILRVRGNYDYHWWAAAYRCNWCAVCNSSLGVAALALLTEDPHLTDVVAESWNRLGKTLDEIGEGGWQEGIGYLNYTVGETLPFATALKRLTGGKLNLFTHPGLESAARTFLYCQVPPDKSVHFSDSGGGKYETYSVFNRLALETGNGAAAWLLRNRTGGNPSEIADLLMPRSTVEPSLPRETSIHFRPVDWVIMRSDFTNPETLVLAAKCGKNDDPHHGHLDVGHFSLYWRGKEFLCDNGSAVQDEAYFHDARWTYPFAASVGHNVALVNGEGQVPGKRKNQPWNDSAGGKVVEFRPGTNRDYALLDPTNAYPGRELKSWRRHLILEKPNIAVVVDEISCAPNAEIEARFHSGTPFDIRGKYALLGSGADMMALIPVVDGGFMLRSGRHAILAADRNSSFRWVPWFGTVVSSGSQRTVIGTVILPVSGDAEAEKIMASVKRSLDRDGNLTLSFSGAGKTYSYRFKNGRDGLIFE